MKKNINKKNDLGYKGQAYQTALLSLIVKEEGFYPTVAATLNQNYFTDAEERTIMGIIRDKYTKLGRVCTQEEIQLYLRESISDGYTLEIAEAKLKRLYEEQTQFQPEVIKEVLYDFLQQQETIKLVNAITDSVKKGVNVDEVRKLYTDYDSNINFNAGVAEDAFFTLDDYFCQLDKQLVKIGTGCPFINSKLDGGLAKKELGVIVSPTGVGKTSITCGFAVAAACYGNKVLHFVLESTREDVQTKYISAMTEIESVDIKNNLNSRKEAQKTLMKNNGKLFNLLKDNIKMVTRSQQKSSFSASEIGETIRQSINNGFTPDLVIVDYFECINSERYNKEYSKWDKEAETIKILEELCTKYNVAMWVPMQSTKSAGIDGTKLHAQDAGGSVVKIQKAHVILAINRNEEHRGCVTLSFAKTRNSKAMGENYVIQFNNGTCHFGDVIEDNCTDAIDNNFINERDTVVKTMLNK